MSQIKNIVFDLGGVLIDWDPRYVFREVFSSEQRMEKFLAEVCNSEWNAKLDEGKPFDEGIAELLVAHSGFQKEIQIYHERWAEMVKGPIEPNVRVLEALHRTKNYRLLALSNWSAEKFYHAEEQFPFLELFEHIVVSGRVKMKKPDLQIFQHLINSQRINPQESVFIDDVIANIESAQSLGFETLHCERFVDLASELLHKGIKF